MLVEIVEANYDNPDHATAIVELTCAYSRDLISSGKPLRDPVKERLVEGLKEHGKNFVMLAFVDQKPVGIATCVIGFSTFEARPLVNIHDLGTLHGYRGMGIGRTLLEAVEAKARGFGCARLTLEVRSDNPASRLYRRYGFCSGAPPFEFFIKSLDEADDSGAASEGEPVAAASV